MEYLYFKSVKGNFGDDLNPWLWPKIFPELSSAEGHFLGIGSILHKENSLLKKLGTGKKIVFGTGVRPSRLYSRFETDSSWDFRFLRGPLSADALGGNIDYITDAAYAIRQLPEAAELLATPKKYEISLMPYFHSVDYFNWEAICAKLGYHYISPFSENGVEHTLREIAASKMIITEAMHGAIAADLLRVPWHRFILSTPHTEGAMVSEFKWTDWLRSVKIFTHDLTYIPFYKKNRLNTWVKKLSGNMFSVETMVKSEVEKDLISKLSGNKPLFLSENQVIQETDLKIASKIAELKAEFISNKAGIIN